jgi:hypothetical protein
MDRRTFVFLALLFAPLPSRAAEKEPPNVDEREEYRKTIQQLREQQDAMAARLNPLPGASPRKFSDLITATVESGHLLLSSPLFKPDMAKPLRDRQWRVDVEGLDRPAQIMVQSDTDGWRSFYFSRTKYPDEYAVDTISVMAQPVYLQISKNFTTDSLHYSVSMIQNRNPESVGTGDAMQLNVYSGGEPGRVSTRISLAEEDFATLRRKHPREVNTHLRPILTELHLESVFAIDPITAWQVFGDDWKPNEAVIAKVKRHLADLESDSYATRAAAGKALKDLGPEGALAIYRMNRAGLSAEQDRQLDAVLAGYPFLPPEQVEPMRKDVNFLLDCLYSDNADIRAIAGRHIREVSGRTISPGEIADGGARGKAIESLRSQLSPVSPTSRPTR